MAFELPLKDLLSPNYNPADDSPLRFHSIYKQLVNRRDFLRNQYYAKEKTRADIKQAEGQ